MTEKILSTPNDQSKAVELLRGLHKAVLDLSEHFEKPITDDNVVRWLALNSAQVAVKAFLDAPHSETASEIAEQARRFRLIQSAYANEYRLRDAVQAELREKAEQGIFWLNAQCRDWPAYVKAIDRRETIVEEAANG